MSEPAKTVTRTARQEVITPTTFQNIVLSAPDTTDGLLGGGRWCGKTDCLMFLHVRGAQQYGKDFRGLYTRASFPAMEELEYRMLAMLKGAYGKGVNYSSQKHRFIFSNGAIIQLDQIESAKDFLKHQGRGWTLVTPDEVGQYPNPEPLDLLRSSMRGVEGVPTRMMMAANPGGQGHWWLYDRYIAGREPFIPFIPEGHRREFITFLGTVADNPHIPEQDIERLEEATQHDPAMRKAWIYGDWAIAKGSFFGSVFGDENILDPWEQLPESCTASGMVPGPSDEYGNYKVKQLRPARWKFFISGDHGSAAPAIFYLCAESPGLEHEGQYFPRGSVILFDEVGFYDDKDLNKGAGLTIPVMCEYVIDRCQQWGIKPEGVMDDACFAFHGSQGGTLADEYMSSGLKIKPAQKGARLGGWQKMRTMMADAGKPDRPGLYVSRLCPYFLRTVPYLGRDKRRPEDVDSNGADHGADAARYALTWKGPGKTVVRKNIGF